MIRLLLFLLVIAADLSAQDQELYRAAKQAIDDGIPQVGVTKLQEYLQTPLTPAQRIPTEIDLANAYTSLNKTEEARQIIARLPVDDETQFLLLQTYLTDKKWSTALECVKTVPLPNSKFYFPTLFARAEAFRALEKNDLADKDYQIVEQDPRLGNQARLRRSDLAIRLGHTAKFSDLLKLSRLDIDADLQTASVLSAENLFLGKEYVKAENRFRVLFENPAGLSETSYGAVCIGSARCLFALNRLDEAEDTLESFIESRPNSEILPLVFSELNTVYESEKSPSPNQLRHWSRDSSNEKRQALAIYYQSQFDLRDRGSDFALATLSGWLAKYPSHPLRASVLLRYGEELLAEKKYDEAIRRLQEGLNLIPKPLTIERLHQVLAASYFESDNFSDAAKQFQQASEEINAPREKLLYNACLSWLRGENFPQFITSFQQFSDDFPESSLRRDLLVEEAFFEARTKQFPQAIQTLNSFINTFPGHRRVAQSYLALAEIALSVLPVDNTLIDQQVALVRQAQPTAATVERTDYLELFRTSDANHPESTHQQIDKCLAFLKTHPGTKLESEIRFRMGEIYFSEKDYTSAGTEFETISDKFPDSPFLEQSRFLAGQSAIRTMNPSAVNGAISLFEEVVRMKGPLQLYARYEQASVKKTSGQLEEALILYNDLLNQNPPSELLAAALAAKGETLYMLGKGKYADAAETFDRLANVPHVSRYWKNLALYKKGKSLGQLGKHDEMLASYYDVIAEPTGAAELPEYFWYYRAGFEAAEILQTDQQWKSAIRIYQRLADFKGPRSNEAGQRIERLRLEHFIWD